MFRKAGFTLLELLFAGVILAGVLIALVGVTIYCFNLAETNYNTSLAYNSARERIENICGAAGNINEGIFTFVPAGLAEGIGRIVIGVVSPGSNVYRIRVIICWRQRGQRIIGEAVDSGGSLIFQDLNGNGVLESPCELITIMTKV